MKYFLMTLSTIAYALASIAYFIWIWDKIWDNINHVSTVDICAMLFFMIFIYIVVTYIASWLFQELFDIDLG